MRKDRWLIIILAVCFVLFTAVLFFWEDAKDKIPWGRSDSEERGDDFDAGSDDVGAASGGGFGSGVSVVINVDEFEEEFVPDISGTECGYYFEGYGVCDGTCPDGGECSSEGRSCYCKKI